MIRDVVKGRRLNQKGFTLMEIMVVMAVGGMIMAAGLLSMYQTIWGTARTNDQVRALTEANIAAMWLKFDLQMAQETLGNAAVTFQPSSQDSYVMQNSPTQTNGSANLMWVDAKESNQNWRSFVQFDLSSIPNGTTITSAILALYMKDPPSGSSRTLQAQRVDGTWAESTVTWNNQPAVSGTAVTTTTGTQQGVWLYWDVSTDVRDFIQYETASNYGWRIKDIAESPAGAEYKESFYTSEESSQTTLRPKLVVTYPGVELLEGVPSDTITIQWTDQTTSFPDPENPHDPIEHSIGYALNGTDLVRTYDSHGKVIARNIDGIEFVRNGDYISVSISASGPGVIGQARRLAFGVYVKTRTET